MRPISRKLFLLTICFAASACREVIVPVPEQRPDPNFRSNLTLFMDPRLDSSASASVIRGVIPDQRLFDWRWIDPHPEFQFALDQTAGLALDVKLTTLQSVVSKTGPQRVNFIVNGKTLKTVSFDRAGTWELAIPLGKGLLKEQANNTVELTTEPCLAPDNGTSLCMLLHRIGFRAEPR